MKLYKGLECPLDGYEIVLFSLSGPDGKTYALCPFCYNNPPFEGAHKVGLCQPNLVLNCHLCQATDKLGGGVLHQQECSVDDSGLAALGNTGKAAVSTMCMR